MKLQQLKEAAQPTKPRGGHYVVYKHDGPGLKAKKIHTVSKGYVYIDTGNTKRDVVAISDLEYVGHGGKGHMWREK